MKTLMMTGAIALTGLGALAVGSVTHAGETGVYDHTQHKAALYYCGDEEVTYSFENGTSSLMIRDNSIALTPVASDKGESFSGTLNGKPVKFWSDGANAKTWVDGKLLEACEKIVCTPL